MRAVSLAAVLVVLAVDNGLAQGRPELDLRPGSDYDQRRREAEGFDRDQARSRPGPVLGAPSETLTPSGRPSLAPSANPPRPPPTTDYDTNFERRRQEADDFRREQSQRQPSLGPGGGITPSGRPSLAPSYRAPR